MRISQSTTTRNRPESAKAAAFRYRRRVERAEMADWKRASHIDPATGRTQTVNIRHCR